MKEFIKNPEWVDAEYESIRDIMKSRGLSANQLPGKAVAFLPADRAERVLALDERLQMIKSFAVPVGLGIMALLGFVLGTMV